MQPIPKPPTAAERAQIADRNDEIGLEYPHGGCLWLLLCMAFAIGIIVGGTVIAVIAGHGG